MMLAKTDPPFVLKYLLLLALQFPVWMAAGMFWAGTMALVFGHHPVEAFLGGLGRGLFMWLICGNLFAVGLAWRRVAEVPVPDGASCLAAVKKAAGKVRLTVLAESADEVVLGRKGWGVVWFDFPESRVSYRGGVATVSAPALTLLALKKHLLREMQASAGGPERAP